MADLEIDENEDFGGLMVGLNIIIHPEFINHALSILVRY
jgi:hypothetical protein